MDAGHHSGWRGVQVEEGRVVVVVGEGGAGRGSGQTGGGRRRGGRHGQMQHGVMDLEDLWGKHWPFTTAGLPEKEKTDS